MKKIITLAILLATAGLTAQVGIGTKTPDASAILELKASATGTQKGLLIPRLSNANRNLILEPPVGLVIYNTNLNALEVVIDDGTSRDKWQDVTTGVARNVRLGDTPYIGKVAIGTTNPDKNSILHLESTSKGLLLPSTATNPTNGVEGMIYYNTTTDNVMLYNGAWIVLTN